MPIIKCPECGDESEDFIFHRCDKMEEKIRQKRRQRWQEASNFRRIFMYDPDTPSATRFISFLWLMPAVLGLLGTLIFLIGFLWTLLSGGDLSWLSDEAQNIPAYKLALAFDILAIFLAYGLSHLKRWSLYLYGAFLIYFFMTTGYIIIGLLGIPGFILVLLDYQKITKKHGRLS